MEKEVLYKIGITTKLILLEQDALDVAQLPPLSDQINCLYIMPFQIPMIKFYHHRLLYKSFTSLLI